MALIEFKDLPDTSTPITADNLNNNFNECYKEDSGWIYPELNTGWSSQYDNSRARYRKIGNIVYLQMFVTGTAEAGNIIFTLPEGFKSSYGWIRLPAYSNESTQIIEILGSDTGNAGAVACYNKSGAVTWLACNTCFLVD